MENFLTVWSPSSTHQTNPNGSIRIEWGRAKTPSPQLSSTVPSAERTVTGVASREITQTRPEASTATPGTSRSSQPSGRGAQSSTAVQVVDDWRAELIRDAPARPEPR